MNTLSTSSSETLAANGVGGSTKVLIGGFDNAGKSTLACSLFHSLNNIGFDASVHELDRWSDTHGPILGYKPWSERAKKPEVSVEAYAAHAEIFKQDQTRVVLGEIEGRFQNPHSRCLKKAAAFAILVTRNPIDKDQTTANLQTLEGWEGLFDELSVPIGIRVHSLREGQTAPAGTLPVRGLERELIPNHPDIRFLAHEVGSLVCQLETARVAW